MNIRSVQSSDYYTLSPLINEWWVVGICQTSFA